MTDSDLLNEPGTLCSCGGRGCSEASAWAEGPIARLALAHVVARERTVLDVWWRTYRQSVWDELGLPRVRVLMVSDSRFAESQDEVDKFLARARAAKPLMLADSFREAEGSTRRWRA